MRILHNPDGLMRSAQFRILNDILQEAPVPEYVYAFERGRSIPAMAQHHVGQGTVISIDLKDFFTSIKQRQLHNMFLGLGVADAPARTLSEICTYESFVPQGALTSPKVSNIIVGQTFGPLVKTYCDSHGLTLTIYADDITISCREDIVAQRGFAAVQEIIDFVSQSVKRFGFRINGRKTKVMRPSQRQYVCGVVVNSKTNLQQRQRRRLRAIVHNCTVNGIPAEAAKSGSTEETFISHVTGKINWFTQLNAQAGVPLMEKFKEAVLSYTQSRETSGSTAASQAETAESTELPWTGS